MKITSFRGKYFFLSNFYPCKIIYEGLEYGSVEAAYQAHKTLDMSIRQLFTKYDAKTAKKEGKKLKIREDWDRVKLPIMNDFVRIKFCIPELKQKLLETGDDEIIEENWWGDTFFGMSNGIGHNHLGKILMRIRLFIYCTES